MGDFYRLLAVCLSSSFFPGMGGYGLRWAKNIFLPIPIWPIAQECKLDFFCKNLITFVLVMKNSKHLIALILIAGIASSSMLYGKRMSMCSIKSGLSVSKKLDMRWEGVRSTQKMFSITQFIAVLFSNPNRQYPLVVAFRSLYLPFVFSSPFFPSEIIPSIFINAP